MTIRDVNWVNGPVPLIDPDYLSGILASTADLAFLVSPEGRIMSALIDRDTTQHARYAEWVGKPMRDYLTSESVPKFDRAVSALADGLPIARRVELNHRDGPDWEFPVRYSFHKSGPGNSVLMLGHDLRFQADVQEQLVRAQIALEEGFEERRAQDARYRVVLANVSEPFLFIDATDGRVVDANTAGAALLGKERDAVIGRNVTSELTHTGEGDLLDAIVAATAARPAGQVSASLGRRGRAVRIEPTSFRATGERMIFCRLVATDAEDPEGEVLDGTLRGLFRSGPEAIAFTNMQGVIWDVNDAFLELTDSARLLDVVQRSLADFFQRGDIDLGVILKHVRRAGRLRIYSTRLASDLGDGAIVDLSATLIDGGGEQRIAFVIRDAERAELLRRGMQPANQNAALNQNVSELVGSATLKEIVAETNDVIERICIETAVEMTKNNRAAAAEMLGLSRQSLYVKLRKYGMLKSDSDD